jgi:hypothetical protein
MVLDFFIFFIIYVWTLEKSSRMNFHLFHLNKTCNIYIYIYIYISLICKKRLCNYCKSKKIITFITKQSGGGWVRQCNVYLRTKIQTFLPISIYRLFVDHIWTICQLYAKHILTINESYFDKIINNILYY